MARLMELKLKIHLDVVKYSLRVQKKSPRGRPGGFRAPNVNLGPPNIPETTIARKLKLKAQLHVVKYSLWAQKSFR